MKIEGRSGRELSVPDITPEQIDHYVQVGKTLRAQAIAGALTKLFAWRAPTVKVDDRVTEPASQPDEAPRIIHRLYSALAAIRSSGELLRDERELSDAERARFVEIVLNEEARLESLLSQLVRTRTDPNRSTA